MKKWAHKIDGCAFKGQYKSEAQYVADCDRWMQRKRKFNAQNLSDFF